MPSLAGPVRPTNPLASMRRQTTTGTALDVSNNRALITGITGQDGSYLAEFLLGKGYEVGTNDCAARL